MDDHPVKDMVAQFVDPAIIEIILRLQRPHRPDRQCCAEWRANPEKTLVRELSQGGVVLIQIFLQGAIDERLRHERV